MTRPRTISRTIWVWFCGAAVLTVATFLACGGPKPIGISTTGTDTRVGTSTTIPLGTDPTTGITTGSSTTTTPPTEADGGNCGITTSNLTKQPADVLLVLDKSGSMTSAIDSTTNCPTGSTTCQQRWATMGTGLDAVLSTGSSDVSWGLKLYNSDGTCGVTSTMEVPISSGANATIQQQIGQVTPGGNTPTRLAINAGVAYLQTLTDTNGKYILLATDGEPNCLSSGAGGRGGGGGSGASDVTGTVAAITAAAAAGFKVYVIGVGPETGNLDNFAAAGGTVHYYPALSPQDLTTALASIVGSVASCTFSLGTKPPPDPNNVAVEFNNDSTIKAPRDTTQVDGWNYATSANTTIQLYGSWCDKVTNGTYTSAKILMGCPGGDDVRR